MRLRTNLAFLVYLEPMKRVCWLQFAFFFAGGANSVSLNPLTGFEGPLRGGGERKMGKNRGKRKGRNEHGPQEWARGALVPLQMLKSVFLSLKCCILSRRSI